MAAKPIAPKRGVNTASIKRAKLTMANEPANNQECGKTSSIPKLIKKNSGRAIAKS